MDYHGDIEKKSERLGDVFKHCANISLAKELISFNPSTNLEIGLNETIQWYKNQKK
jgi:UDP-glucose 4-epimerase